jgi:hypothetical protein
MKQESEPVDPSPDTQHVEDSATARVMSLTDLLDEMDRAAFRRSLASRDARDPAGGRGSR